MSNGALRARSGLWWVVLCLPVICSFPLFSQVSPTQQQQFPERAAASASLTLIQSSDSTFEDLLDTYFPGLSSTTNYQAIRPFLTLVQNNTGLGAVAYAIQ